MASGLPQGPPVDRGLPLDPSIPGSATFAKPVDDIREDSSGEGSIHRVDGPDGWAKEQPDPENDQRQLEIHPGYAAPGKSLNVTRYPYRDDKETTHNASSRFVVASFLLESARQVISRKWNEILQGLNPKFVERSKGVEVKIKRVDRKNLRWIFQVKGNHTYAVKMKVLRRGNVQDILKMDLEISCSCPAWRWQGPEYHATQEAYQLGKLQGTASPPDIRDPERENFVCKHVAAVLSFVKGWKIPPSKAKSPARKKKK